MKKFWIVVLSQDGKNFGPYTGKMYEDRAQAEAEAKRGAAAAAKINTANSTYYIVEAVAAAQVPVPDINLVEIK